MSNAEKLMGAQRSRVWSQHPQLSSLSAARAMSMAGRQNLEAAPGQCAAASALHWPLPTALARLESQRTSACLYPARAAPTPRSEPVASRRFATPRERDPLPGATCALAPLVGRAARSQCAPGNFWTSRDQVVRHPSRLCHLTRFRDSLTLRFSADRLPLLGQAGFSE